MHQEANGQESFLLWDASILEILLIVYLAEIIYGHQLQKFYAFLNKLDKFSNPAVWPMKKKAC